MSPLQGLIYDGANWTGGGVAVDPPDDFALGTTMPTADNTGPRAGVLRTTMFGGVNTTWTINAPGEYSAFNMLGDIVIASDDVWLHDFDLEMGAGKGNGISCTLNTANNVRIDFGRVRGPVIPTLNQGIRGAGAVITRTHVFGVGDGGQVYTNASYPYRMSHWLGCCVENLIVVADPGQQDGFSHNDDNQLQGNVAYRAIGNYFKGGRTSCIIATTGTSTVYPYLEIMDNWMEGHPTEGSTINISANTDITGLKVFRNRIWNTGKTGGGGPSQIRGAAINMVASRWGMVGSGSTGAAWTPGPDCNVYYQTGLPVPVANG